MNSRKPVLAYYTTFDLIVTSFLVIVIIVAIIMIYSNWISAVPVTAEVLNKKTEIIQNCVPLDDCERRVNCTTETYYFVITEFEILSVSEALFMRIRQGQIYTFMVRGSAHSRHIEAIEP